MRKVVLTSLAVCAAVLFGAPARAQQAPLVYGPGLNLEIATKAVNAAVAEAKKNGWFMAIAVTTNGGYLVHFSRMDGTQFASIKIAQHKARTAATYRRPTKALADALAAGNSFILTLDDVIAVDGGLPLIGADGKMIGAIGCSGATGAQDAQACMAGVNAIK